MSIVSDFIWGKLLKFYESLQVLWI